MSADDNSSDVENADVIGHLIAIFDVLSRISLAHWDRPATNSLEVVRKLNTFNSHSDKPAFERLAQDEISVCRNDIP